MRTAGARTVGTQTAGTQTAGTLTVGTLTVGTQPAGTQTAGTQTADVNSQYALCPPCLFPHPCHASVNPPVPDTQAMYLPSFATGPCPSPSPPQRTFQFEQVRA
eukprot:322973-Chlamydomonas_euryale.AAC.1